MLRTTVLLAALGLANAAALPEPYASPAIEVDPTGRFESCVKAPNCEVYMDSNGREMIRFVRGMGPGSAWFEEHVMPHVANDTESDLEARDNGFALEARATKATTNLIRARRKIHYGDKGPLKVLQTLRNVCISSSCNVFAYKIPTNYVARSNSNWGSRQSANINVQPSGDWHPGQRDYYMKAVEEMAKRSTRYNQDYHISSVGPQIGTSTQFEGSGYLEIQRFVSEGAMAGHLSVDLRFKETGPDVCSGVTTFLSGLMGAAGPVGGIAGGFFGALGTAFCDPKM